MRGADIRSVESLAAFGGGFFGSLGAMPCDPKQCRENAARCEELAKTARNFDHARVLLNLAKQWLKLAAEQERVRSSSIAAKKVSARSDEPSMRCTKRTC
jgi:hypothetical protein